MVEDRVGYRKIQVKLRLREIPRLSEAICESIYTYFVGRCSLKSFGSYFEWQSDSERYISSAAGFIIEMFYSTCSFIHPESGFLGFLILILTLTLTLILTLILILILMLNSPVPKIKRVGRSGVLLLPALP